MEALDVFYGLGLLQLYARPVKEIDMSSLDGTCAIRSQKDVSRESERDCNVPLW